MPAPPQESAARRYRIEKYLTEGGMGAIYIGKKLGPGGFAKEVVLKQLLPEYTARPEFRDLFFREAKISATLDHANIVHTFDLVESDQSLFIVMEYVRGADLRTIIRRARHRKRELSPAAAIHIALEILAGLSYAHGRRDAHGTSLDIIHRDVSPSNIICSIQGAAKLSDFGIAKASTYSSVFYRVRGKVGYMSPEQARSQQIDHRCDLFSLSVCLYESLSGERLFVGDLNTPADEIYGIKPLPVSRKRAGLPAALDDVLARALAPNVEDRYQSAAELADALRTVAYKSGLAFSAPELASHLQDILGPDPERWLREEPPMAAPDSLAVPGGGSELVGKEAASLGIVNHMPEDEPGPSVLSPRAVSGSKDFDLDSMLNDEATHPGGEVRRAPEMPQTHARPDENRSRPAGTPPPVWTRDSGPFALATPNPNPNPNQTIPDSTLSAAQSVIASAPSTRAASPASPQARQPPALPGVQPAPPVPPASRASRPLPRATIRGPGVPPPFQPVGRGAPPPPPPRPRSSTLGAGAVGSGDDIEDATPGPSAARSQPQPGGFEIEDVLTPPPPQGATSPAAAAQFRAPPAPYPMAPVEAPVVPAAVVMQPAQTIDFSDAVTALLPEKKSGPPGWLAAMLLPVALVGGAALAHRVTRSEVAAALAVGQEPPTPTRSATGTEAPAAQDPAATASAKAKVENTADDKSTVRPAPRVGDGDNALDAPSEANLDAAPTTDKTAKPAVAPPSGAAHSTRTSKGKPKHHPVKVTAKRRTKH